MISQRRFLIGLIIIAVMFLGNGWLLGFYTGTGTFPWVSHSVQVELPPESQVVPSEAVAEALVEDTTSEQEYEQGFNCLDYAWKVMRALQWQGIDTRIVKLDYGNDSGHAVLLIPTTDRGWIFVDPQSDQEIEPYVGGFYQGRTIKSIDVLVMKWVDIETYNVEDSDG